VDPVGATIKINENKRFHHLYPSSNIVRAMKTKNRMARDLAHMSDTRNAYKILHARPKDRIILK
jgi:hypothetical protein